MPARRCSSAGRRPRCARASSARRRRSIPAPRATNARRDDCGLEAAGGRHDVMTSRQTPGSACRHRRRDAAHGRGARGAGAARRDGTPGGGGGAAARALQAALIASGSAERHCRMQAPLAVARRAEGRLRSGGDRARLRARGRGGDLRADRAGFLRRHLDHLAAVRRGDDRCRFCARTSSSIGIRFSKRARPAPTRFC